MPTLPPVSTTPGLSGRTFPASSAANPTAPLGSTTSFRRSNRNRSAIRAEFLQEKARALEARDPQRLVAAVTEHLDAFRGRVLEAWEDAAAHVPA